jgi:glycosyltransferase involved in cell wall biosynthesis
MKISVITPCLNRAEFIVEVVESVLAQNYPYFEHIIVDGGSTDGTFDVLKKYKHLTVISEPDQGMYDALNKGLDLAQGEIVGFLNTDDLYAPNIFDKIVKQFKDRELDAVGGQAVFFEENKRCERIEKMRLSSSPPEGLFKQIVLSGCLMNAWFFRRDICRNVGAFNPKYKISGDADFMIRLKLWGFKYKLLDFATYFYFSHADSLTMALNEKKLQKILKDASILADSYIGMDFAPMELQNLLRNVCLAIGSQLADIYFQDSEIDKIIELGNLLSKYDPTWIKKYLNGNKNIQDK